MNLDIWCRFLLFSLVINYTILMLWFTVFVFARNWMKQLHGKWFRLSEASFDVIHYSGMALYKIGILLFNLAPLIAIYLIKQS
ncbi:MULTISPECIES: DUF6868 family protein [Acinetobacter]|uniref:DUF6868 family protein n=1 Tax=Acinetobacter TaxID=469 RepID=UPI0002D002EF|nr:MULTISPECIES: hypothetical protein [Acinetobacter]ENW23073.1 hypothetical protein F925_02948 [Acinetobacter lwoffii NCTC 5866 = CIP 64.10 = NIPH 512]PJI28643.1 hypothetical protein CU478_13420 [Acinetobacter pseudolwoffii]PJI35897.1 hypothetical protein CU318_06340 [Acinetobacter pseudolwoffii]UBX52951.1 hypothetical protein LDO52_02995 [Acinetobacter pseudolwoffii]